MVRRRRLFYVYAVELVTVEDEPRAVYVGQSALPPEDRFLQHTISQDPATSRHVRHRGKKLLPHLYEHHNPMTSREEAREAEQTIRRALEKRGVVVYGACTVGRDRGCRL